MCLIGGFMLDQYVVPKIKAPLKALAALCNRHGIGADQVTLVGFVIGVLSVVALIFGQFFIALVLLLLNRLADGIDGELARINGGTDAGAFLDIILDFIFYALFPLGFALYDPAANALAAAILIASFVGTGASFLAFDSFARRRKIEHPDFAYKGLYYLNGLAEGTETVLTFVLMCLLPQYFVLIASLFALVCVLTAANRVVFGYMTLRRTGI